MTKIIFNLNREILIQLIIDCEDPNNRELLARGLRALKTDLEVLHVIHESELKGDNM